MTTGPKVASDVAERKQEPLGLPRGGEPFHHLFPDSGRLMGILSPIVQVLRPAMGHRRHELAVRHRVAGQLVGDNHPGHLPQALAQSAEQLLCGHRVSARPHQNVEHVAVLVDRAPQVPPCAVDLNEHLIEVPVVAWPRITTAQLVRLLLPEPLAPGPQRLIGHLDTTFEHQPPHGAETQREPVIQPDAMADDLGPKPEPFIPRGCTGHDRRSCPTSPSRLTNLTVPRQAGLVMVATNNGYWSWYHVDQLPVDAKLVDGEDSWQGASRAIPYLPAEPVALLLLKLELMRQSRSTSTGRGDVLWSSSNSSPKQCLPVA